MINSTFSDFSSFFNNLFIFSFELLKISESFSSSLKKYNYKIYKNKLKFKSIPINNFKSINNKIIIKIIIKLV